MSESNIVEQNQHIPISALLLGVAGLIPFFGLAVWQGVSAIKRIEN